jgi:hypothetical protein
VIAIKNFSWRSISKLRYGLTLPRAGAVSFLGSESMARESLSVGALARAFASAVLIRTLAIWNWGTMQRSRSWPVSYLRGKSAPSSLLPSAAPPPCTAVQDGAVCCPVRDG